MPLGDKVDERVCWAIWAFIAREEGLFGNLQGLAHLTNRLAASQHGVGVPQQPKDLFRAVSLPSS